MNFGYGAPFAGVPPADAKLAADEAKTGKVLSELPAGAPATQTSAMTGTVAPTAAPEAGAGGFDFSSLMDEAQSIGPMGRRAAAEQRAGAEEYERRQAATATEMGNLEAAKQAATKKAIDDTSKELQVIQVAQGMVDQESDKRLAELETRSAAHQKEWDVFMATSHPTDIWGAAGVDPIMGSIAMALGQLGTFMGGTNSVAETIKMRANVRAQQIAQQASALGQRGERIHQMFNESINIHNSKSAALDKLRANYIQQSELLVKSIASEYGSPMARLKADEVKNALYKERLEIIAKADETARRATIDGLHAETNVAQLMIAANAKIAGTDKMNQTDYAKAKSELEYTNAAMTDLDQVLSTGGFTLNPVKFFEHGSSAKLLVDDLAGARGIPGGSVSKYIPQLEHAGGIIRFAGDKGAFISSENSLKLLARGALERQLNNVKLNRLKQQDLHAAEMMTLEEFDKRYPTTGATDKEKAGANRINQILDAAAKAYEADKAAGKVE